MLQPTKNTLSPQRKRLVELMQNINFGHVLNIPVRSGEPHFTNSTIIEREIKFGGQNGPRPELAKSDFALKHDVMELLDMLTKLGDGIIQKLEVKNGLPTRMFVQEPAVR